MILRVLAEPEDGPEGQPTRFAVTEGHRQKDRASTTLSASAMGSYATHQILVKKRPSQFGDGCRWLPVSVMEASE